MLMQVLNAAATRAREGILDAQSCDMRSVSSSQGSRQVELYARRLIIEAPYLELVLTTRQ